MFSFFKKRAEAPTDAGPTVVDHIQMTLSERSQWRDDMINKAIRDVFAGFDIISGMYRFRIMPLDDRHHYFAVMIDTTKHFAMCKHTSTPKLAQIEELIKTTAMNAYELVVEGVYWKVNETVEVFEKPRDIVIPSNRPKRSIKEIAAADFGDTIPSLHMDNDSWEKDQKIVDGKFYNTDISPLARN